MKDHLTEILVHEITHAMEFRAETSKRANRYDERMIDRCRDDYGPECEEIYTHYYNTPVEVSAMTNEIVYQIIYNSEGALPSRVEDALDLSIKWEEIEPYLTKKNKDLIRKRVYTRLYTGEVTLRASRHGTDLRVDIVALWRDIARWMSRGSRFTVGRLKSLLVRRGTKAIYRRSVESR